MNAARAVIVRARFDPGDVAGRAMVERCGLVEKPRAQTVANRGQSMVVAENP